ncbi:uncharacterized protein LOC144582685 isoform X2 [Callithrix jacchus]
MLLFCRCPSWRHLCSWSERAFRDYGTNYTLDQKKDASRPVHEQLPVSLSAPHGQHEGPSEPSPGPTFSQSLTSPPLMELPPIALPRLSTANLFLLISSILGSQTTGPHTQFVQWFMEECVDCQEQGGRGSVLQFRPFTTVSELVKVSAMSNPKVVLAITDLSLPLGRQVAAKAIAAL